MLVDLKHQRETHFLSTPLRQIKRFESGQRCIIDANQESLLAWC